MNKLPPHIENEIRKNPTAVLTSRGLVKPNAGGIDEVLIGIPNAVELYGEHFNLIREQDVNREVIQPKDKTDETVTENSESPAAGELVDEPKKELEKEPESVELTAEEKEAARRKALSEAAKARHAAKKAAAEAEAKKAAE